MDRQGHSRRFKRQLAALLPFLVALVAIFVFQKWEWLGRHGWVRHRPPPGAADSVARALVTYITVLKILGAVVLLVALVWAAVFIVRCRMLSRHLRRLEKELDEQEREVD